MQFSQYESKCTESTDERGVDENRVDGTLTFLNTLAAASTCLLLHSSTRS
jgi:hypothetical protein